MRTLEEIVAFAETLHFDVNLSAVSRFRESHDGQKAVAHMPIYFPRELISAHRMLPVGLMGASGQLEIIRGDAYFQSYICQIPRSTIELALTGRLDLIDGFIFPSICDVIRNLSGMWKILFPQKYVRYFDVPQNYDQEVGGRFYVSELRSIFDELRELSDSPGDETSLRRSIGDYNRHRRLIRKLFDLRRHEPWRAPAHEVYLVMRAGNVLSVEEHIGFIEEYLGAVFSTERPMRDQTRVVMTGSFCEQPPLELIKTLEQAGCYIVWDDLLLGQHWLLEDVDEGGDPFRALAEAFLAHSTKSAVRYEPEAQKGEHLVQIVKRTQAEGVIFSAPSFCDPALLDQPMLQTALDRAKIPWTAFKYAENLGQFQVIREQTGTFADSVKLWSEA